MIVTVGQFNASTDKRANLAAAARLIERAAGQRSELVVLPEYTMHYDPDKSADLARDAEPVDGPFASEIASLARTHELAVVVGMTEASVDGGKPSNTVIAVDASGSPFGAYRKVHLYDAFGLRESDRIAAHPPVALTFTLGDITFGVMTCYDLRFAEMARYLVDAGAQALVVPAAWVAGPAKEDHWMTLARARAIENTTYVLAAGQTGPTCTGQSAIIDPMGHPLASAGEMPGVASAIIDAERLRVVRETNPSLGNRKFAVAFG